MNAVDSNKPLYYEDIKIIFDNKCIRISQFLNEEPINLDYCLEFAKRNGYKDGTILVIVESYMSGEIFRYGNYSDDSWYKVGVMNGFS